MKKLSIVTAALLISLSSFAISSIHGSGIICTGSIVTLTDSALGGTWLSDNPSVAIINPVSGKLTGIAAGSATITYTLGASSVTTIETVTSGLAPSPITGADVFCPETVHDTLHNSTPGGTWSGGSPTLAWPSVDGVLSHYSLCGSGCHDVAIISYTLPSGCYTTYAVTVDPITHVNGFNHICLGTPVTLYGHPSGGTWTTSTPSIATVIPSGVATGVSSGNPVFTYWYLGCSFSPNIYHVYGPITGVTSICTQNISLLNTDTVGHWLSSSPEIATIGSSTGLVTAIAPGTAIISYSPDIFPLRCYLTTVVTIDPLPAQIGGEHRICMGQSVVLTDSVIGGQWTSANLSVATINLVTGSLTAISAGIAYITYTLPSGCFRTTTVTIDPLPCNTAASQTETIGKSVIFPNPANDQLNIAVKNGEYESFQIVNQIGQILLTGKLMPELASIDIKNLGVGFYYIKLIGKDGNRNVIFSKNQY